MFTRSTYAVLAAAFLVAANAPNAGAAVSSFALSPSSGPPGTVVHVSGTGCAPGLLLNGALDFVQVAATSAPPASLHLAVSSGGAWSGTFTVPANQPAAPIAVTALCISDGLQSILTAYLPQTFTVTATGPPTTVPSTPPPTNPVGTTVPASAAPAPATPGSTTASTAPHANPGNSGGGGSDGGGGGSTAPGDGTPGAHNSPASGPGATTSGGATGAAGRAGTTAGQRGALAADLSAPGLTLSRHRSGGGLTWLAWLLIVALIVACASATAWLRWGRRPKATPDAMTDAMPEAMS